MYPLIPKLLGRFKAAFMIVNIGPEKDLSLLKASFAIITQVRTKFDITCHNKKEHKATRQKNILHPPFAVREKKNVLPLHLNIA
jgi:hypothetical protein